MEKKHRTILFIVALILFFIISLFVILYSQGYKFDFEKKKFVETGGFYIQIINNSPFSVYLNDKPLKKKPSLFSNSFFIKNLLPKKHKIEIKKEGYFSWQKTLEVKEKEVLKILDILLIKNPLVFNLVVDNLKTEDLKNYLELKEEKENQGFYLKDNTLFKELSPILNNLIAFKIINDDLFWLSNSGFLTKSGLNGQIKEILNQFPFPTKEKAKYQIEVFNSKIFLLENDALYYLSPKKREVDEVLSGVNIIKSSPDFKKIAVICEKGNELWILNFSPRENIENKEVEYEKVFLTRFSKKIGNLDWLFNSHLIINIEGEKEVIITEIDERDKLNLVSVANFNNPQIFFSKKEKRIYIFSENQLFASERITP